MRMKMKTLLRKIYKSYLIGYNLPFGKKDTKHIIDELRSLCEINNKDPKELKVYEGAYTEFNSVNKKFKEYQTKSTIIYLFTCINKLCLVIIMCNLSIPNIDNHYLKIILIINIIYSFSLLVMDFFCIFRRIFNENMTKLFLLDKIFFYIGFIIYCFINLSSTILSLIIKLILFENYYFEPEDKKILDLQNNIHKKFNYVESNVGNLAIMIFIIFALFFKD